MSTFQLNFKMATCYYCVVTQWIPTLLLLLTVRKDCLTLADREGDKQIPQAAGIVHFNNPKLLENLNNQNDKDGIYMFDTSQEAVDPKKMGGIVIQQEAENFAYKFRMLSNEEVGVTAMQVCVK